MTKDELVERYQVLHEQKAGHRLPPEDALEQALKLVHLVKIIYPQEWFKKQKQGITKGNM